MNQKKGLFNFIKGWSNPVISEEEKQQRDYAMAQESGKTVQETKVASDDDIVTEEIETFCIEKLEEILTVSKFRGKVKFKSKNSHYLYLEIFDLGEDAGRVIGKNGSTLQSLQILLRSFIIRKFSVAIKVILDAGDYKSKRDSQIKSRALKAAEEVIHSGSKVKLDPMNAHERRFVHMLFEKDKDVESISEGEGRDRCVTLVKRGS